VVSLVFSGGPRGRSSCCLLRGPRWRPHPAADTPLTGHDRAAWAERRAAARALGGRPRAEGHASAVRPAGPLAVRPRAQAPLGDPRGV